MAYKRKKKATNHKILKSVDAAIAQFNAYDTWLKRQPKAPAPLHTWEVGKYTTELQIEMSMNAAVEPCGKFYRLILTNNTGEQIFTGRFAQDEKGFLYLQGKFTEHAGKNSTLPNGVESIVGSFEEFATAFCISEHVPVKQETIKLLPAPERIDLNLVKDLAVAV